MWKRAMVVVAACLAMVDNAAAAGFFLPPDFGGNSPNVALAVGDSITFGTLGTGAQAPQPYPAVLQSLLQPANPGFLVLNRGQGGETTAGGLARLAGVLAADHPAFVLIMEGTNDATFEISPDVIVANLRAMVRLAKANFSIPILGAIIPNQRDVPETHAIIAAVNAMLPAVAAEEGIRFVDTFSPLNDGALFGGDLLHPTEQGYAILGAAWQPAVSAAITQSRALLGGVTVAGFNAAGAGQILTGFAQSIPPPTAQRFAPTAPHSAIGPAIGVYASAFLGGVRVAACPDVTGDGVDEMLLAPGPGGGPHVRLLDGATGQSLAEFFAYAPAFTGGVFVACGNVEGTPNAVNIITGAGRGGGPHVRILRYDSSAPGGVVPIFDFLAYPAGFAGGVHVAVGDVNGDGRAEIITGAGPGGGPHVRVLTFAGGGLTSLGEFFAYDPAFPGGVFVAAGDVTGSGLADVITGAGPGGGPHVRVMSQSLNGTSVTDFFAYDPAFSGGVYVGAGELTGGGKAEIITGAGPGGGPHVRGFTGAGQPTGNGFLAYQ
jgi:lysophospholipase L1-like esterase